MNVSKFILAAFLAPSLCFGIDAPPLEQQQYTQMPARPIPQATLQTFTISNGEKVQLPVVAGEPLPAQAEGFRMEVAGPIVGPLGKGSSARGLSWAFSVSGTTFRQCEQITVEDVSGPTAVEIVRVDKPQCDPGIVNVHSPAVEVTPTNLAWLYEQGPTTKVFRITISTSGPMGGTAVLLQPSKVSAEGKAVLLNQGK